AGTTKDTPPIQSSAQSAFRLGLVDPQRIELGELVQKPGLRRYRDERAGIGEQDRLAQLAIPGSEAEPRALAGGDPETLPAHERDDCGGIGRFRPRRRLADRAHRHPGGIIAVGHPTFGLVKKTLLELGRAPLLVRAGPGAGDEALGPGDRTRIEGAVGEIVAELVLLIGDDKNIVLDALRKTRDLGLDR